MNEVNQIDRVNPVRLEKITIELKGPDGKTKEKEVQIKDHTGKLISRKIIKHGGRNAD